MDNLEQLMEACEFTKPGDTGIYKHWNEYLAEAARFAIGETRPRTKKRNLMLLGLYSLFIEFVAGRLPDTLDEATDGAVYMSRAAMEFRDQFIRAMIGADADE